MGRAGSGVQVAFVCQACGHQAAKWMGRCPECQAWNTLTEEKVSRRPPSEAGGPAARPVPLAEISAEGGARTGSPFGELDRVLGGGWVRGSVTLLGGEPGAGKSTLLLQVAHHAASSGARVLYVSGEESPAQVKLRAERLGALSPQLLILAESDLEAVRESVEHLQPALLIVDSIQTIRDPALASPPGTVSQIRECAQALVELAKRREITTVLVGHVTKEGALAGPKVLEHVVDVVLSLEGDRERGVRMVRAVKNRFGATSELAVFEMRSTGFAEVANPSEYFLSERPEGMPGSVVISTVEGARPLLVEVQALTSPSYFGTPQRRATGVEGNRLAMLVAVLDKRAGLHVGGLDIFVNVAGGLQVSEPAADLGLALAIASSFRDRPVEAGMVVVGEVGLAGEVRAVAGLEQRLQEASRLGFRGALVPAARHRPLGLKGFEERTVATVEDAIRRMME